MVFNLWRFIYLNSTFVTEPKIQFLPGIFSGSFSQRIFRTWDFTSFLVNFKDFDSRKKVWAFLTLDPFFRNDFLMRFIRMRVKVLLNNCWKRNLILAYRKVRLENCIYIFKKLAKLKHMARLMGFNGLKIIVINFIKHSWLNIRELHRQTTTNMFNFN